jgi:hypothetical protein
VSARHARAGQLGALAKWGRETDRTSATAPARRAAEDRWYLAVRAEHPDLDETTVRLMAGARKREHFIRMAHKSAASRRRRGAA